MISISFLLVLSICTAKARETSEKYVILITNATVFDGQHENLAQGMSMLVKGNKITKIAKTITAPQGATVIEAKGKTLMPGLTDVHWHVMFNTPSIPMLMNSDLEYLTLLGAQSCHTLLMEGFTRVRDVGGNPFSIKKAIDQGLIDGPRIYPSGPMISQTSGHSDNRTPTEPEDPIYLEKFHMLAAADGVPEVMTEVRRNLRMGATQIKNAAGGGVSSNYDPLDVTEYTFEEMKAAVDVAKTWNTYVAIHANTDDAIQMAIRAGILSVENGFLMKEETLKLMADGTDILFDAKLIDKHGKMLVKLTKWYTPVEALKMATYDNCQLIKMCGPRDPDLGDLGVIKENALADILLVDGNPLENLDLVADPDKNFVLIMKDGKIYKNTLK